jgi:ribosome maturation factor RimP
MDIIEQIRSFFKEQEGQGFFLVDVKATPGDQITIYADKDKNITLDECTTIHRTLIEKIPTAGDYEITVSSPGMDQPFKVAEQYKKYMGRDVNIVAVDGQRYSGKLTGFANEKVTIEEKKKSGTVEHNFNLQNIKSTQLSISFNKTINQ